MAVYNFDVLKTSQKGALLITNGEKIAWVQRRAQRKDGTFGDGALRALTASKIAGKCLEDLKKFNDQIVSVQERWAPSFETEKAWKIGSTWFPKSLCKLEKNEDKMFTLTGPRWVILKEYFEEDIH